MRYLGIIPARGGSRRLPNKNTIDFHGHPLIWWTVRAAIRSGVLCGVIVTSDSAEILAAANAAARDHHGEPTVTLLQRPPELAAGEDGSMIRTVQHALAQADPHNFSYDAAVLLQPTSPLRHGEHISKAVQHFEAHQPADSLVAQNPEGRTNGAIYITKTSVLRAGGPIYNHLSIRFAMNKWSSIDIDTSGDLARARDFMAMSASHLVPHYA